VELLAERNATLSLVEIGTGGSLAAALSAADGARRVLAGAYVAPNAEKLLLLLGVRDKGGEESHRLRTERLARVAAAATASKCTIVVGQPWKNERRIAYVDVVFRLPDGRLEGREVRFRGMSDPARGRLVTQLLDMLRRRLK
jgi:nicotinamide mononucleotide (NMN) deamidase PncC